MDQKLHETLKCWLMANEDRCERGLGLRTETVELRLAYSCIAVLFHKYFLALGLPDFKSVPML